MTATSTFLSRTAVTLAALCCLGAAQAANNFSKTTYDGAKKDIEAAYKADKDACGSMKDNAKDVCMEQAKANEKTAKAQLEFNYTGKASDEAKVVEARYDGRYDVAKEKCDDMSGNAKDVCVKEAKASHDKSKADLKAQKKVADAQEDAIVAKMDADYKVAKEKCDAMSGDQKDVCVASAKARYNQRW